MELLERQLQLGELTRLLREARSGSGKFALVVGEAGAGQSALAERFVEATERLKSTFDASKFNGWSGVAAGSD